MFLFRSGSDTCISWCSTCWWVDEEKLGTALPANALTLLEKCLWKGNLWVTDKTESLSHFFSYIIHLPPIIYLNFIFFPVWRSPWYSFHHSPLQWNVIFFSEVLPLALILFMFLIIYIHSISMFWFTSSVLWSSLQHVHIPPFAPYRSIYSARFIFFLHILNRDGFLNSCCFMLTISTFAAVPTILFCL